MAEDDKRVALKNRKRDAPAIEMHDDAWDRFRSAVHTMTKAGPQHRAKPLKDPKSPGKRKTVKKG